MPSPDSNKRICGAKNRQGKPCQRCPDFGRTRCNLHGGKSPRGADSPQYKHGLYSKYLPPSVAEKYEEVSADPRLMKLNNDVALLTTRLMQIIQRLDTVISERWLDDLIDLHKRFGEAEDAGEGKAIYEMIGVKLRSGKSENKQWAEVRQILQEKAKLTAAEAQRLQTVGAMLPADQAHAMMDEFASIVLTHVKDDKIRTRIANDIEGLKATSPALFGVSS